MTMAMTNTDSSPSSPDPVDVHVGSRIRLRRRLLRISQKSLGEALGLSLQQIQKYEKGASRVGASRLYKIAERLDVPVSFFFDDIEDGHQASAAPDIKNSATLEIAARLSAIEDPALRDSVVRLIDTLSAGQRGAGIH